MSGRVRLIWDFYGPAAERTAAHHRGHVAEFAEREQLSTKLSGCEQFAPGHWIAWLVVDAEDVPSLRVALRPQRGLPA